MPRCCPRIFDDNDSKGVYAPNRVSSQCPTLQTSSDRSDLPEISCVRSVRFRPVLIKRLVAVVVFAFMCQSCTGRLSNAQPPAYFLQFTNTGQHGATIAQLTNFLARSGVDHVVPIHELLQQGTDWSTHRQPRYAIPPQHLWPNMVRTLKLIDRFIIPAVGPIEVVSGFRSPVYNQLARGARQSKHMEFSALDVISRSGASRNTLHNRLIRVWNVHGGQLDMGLGLYGSGRFHIDTSGYRKWRG